MPNFKVGDAVVLMDMSSKRRLNELLDPRLPWLVDGLHGKIFYVHPWLVGSGVRHYSVKINRPGTFDTYEIIFPERYLCLYSTYVSEKGRRKSPVEQAIQRSYEKFKARQLSKGTVVGYL